MRRALLLTLLCLGVPGCAGTPDVADGTAAPPGPTIVDAEVGEAIAFVRATGTPVDATFRKEQLPALVAAARKLGVPLRVVEVGDEQGASAAVAITPLLVYQNHRGRSIFQGRTTRSYRFLNFLRTARYVPQGPEPLRREEVLVRRAGRSTVAVKLKVTRLAGTQPPGFDPQVFQRHAQVGIQAGFARLSHEHHVDLGRADRTYYADFYPYRDAGGQLHVSVALYSQFNCDIPVFQPLDSPSSGDFDAVGKVFHRAAARLQEAVLASIESPTDGDGFDAMPASVPAVEWHDIGLTLPERPADAADRNVTVELVSAWELPPPADGDPPRLQFEFLPPLDYYSGEVTDVRCTLELDAELTLRSLRAEVIANATTVTMGEEMLDDSLQAPDTLHTARHPEARFVVECAEADPGRLAFGATVTVTVCLRHEHYTRFGHA